MKKILILSILLTIFITGCTLEDTENLAAERQEIGEEIEEKVEVVVNQSSNEENLLSTSHSQEIVTTIEQVDQKISIWEDSNAIKKNENVLKNTFVTLVDFIFYDGTISGISFSELTDDVKVKVLDLLNKIDQKIESVSPNYKENLSKTTSEVYAGIKEKAISLKESILEKYVETVGEDGYQNTKEALQEDVEHLKDAYHPYIEKGKKFVDDATEKGKNVYENAKDKVNSWYQEWKESE